MTTPSAGALQWLGYLEAKKAVRRICVILATFINDAQVSRGRKTVIHWTPIFEETRGVFYDGSHVFLLVIQSIYEALSSRNRSLGSFAIAITWSLE